MMWQHSVAHRARVVNMIDDIVEQLAASVGPVHILVMSNGGFGGLHSKLVARLVL
jgi:UDP-N-acetylmuramate: L-alanyl-gamma-D-glutamyl-meso-diaminopimelate ligase